MNWKELWGEARPLKTCRDAVRDKLEFVRMDNSTAEAYANYGPGRSPKLTAVTCDIKELEISIRCTVEPVQNAGECNTVADALSFFVILVSDRDPCPTNNSYGRNSERWSWRSAAR